MIQRRECPLPVIITDPCRYARVLEGLPSGLLSRQPGQVEASGGGRSSVGCCGAEGRWSSSCRLPYMLDPGSGQTLASLAAGSVTSRSVEGGNPGGACRGHAGPEEH